MDWVFSRFPGIAAVRGHGENQGGLLHRLDYETRGLVLIARTSEAFTALAAQQARGEFIKEYEALSGTGEPFPGFPPRPFSGRIRYIESAFRPYGKGQRAVRPLPPERGGEKPLYRTEILSCGEGPEKTGLFRLRLARGFRHQIRCHLAWIGRPLLNDPLYGGPPFPGGFLALRACALVFTDPLTGERREYRI
jgi:23S rRNA pseudouridine1911/1915/1917 synthase